MEIREWKPGLGGYLICPLCAALIKPQAVEQHEVFHEKLEDVRQVVQELNPGSEL